MHKRLANQLRIAYSEGVIVAILVPFVLYFLGLLTILNTLFLCFFLVGVWTVISSFLLVRREELNVYLMWGLILACASTVFVIAPAYAVALILVAVIASVILFVSTRKTR